MSHDKMDSLPLAVLMAIAAGAIKNILPDGEKEPEPAQKLDLASI